MRKNARTRSNAPHIIMALLKTLYKAVRFSCLTDIMIGIYLTHTRQAHSYMQAGFLIAHREISF